MSLIFRRLEADRFEAGEKPLEHSCGARLLSIRTICRLLLCSLLFLPCCGRQTVLSKSEKHDAATLIQPLIDPAKLATLGDRGANQRVQEVTAILWQTKLDGQDPAEVAENTVQLNGWGRTEKD